MIIGCNNSMICLELNLSFFTIWVKCCYFLNLCERYVLRYSKSFLTISSLDATEKNKISFFANTPFKRNIFYKIDLYSEKVVMQACCSQQSTLEPSQKKCFGLSVWLGRTKVRIKIYLSHFLALHHTLMIDHVKTITWVNRWW